MDDKKVFDTNKYKEFIRIVRELNLIGITPVLMGSLGLEFTTGVSWNAQDIDIHVPGDARGWEAPDEDRIYQWNEIVSLMSSLGYEMIDLHEHEFQNEDISVEYGCINTLPEFANVEVSELPLYHRENVNFHVPNATQFLAIYQASSKDSYRNEKNNDKDFAKIEFLTKCQK